VTIGTRVRRRKEKVLDMTPERRRNVLIACALAFLIVSVVLEIVMALTGMGQPLPELLAWWAIAAAVIALALK
jgi:hypothetical protein